MHHVKVWPAVFLCCNSHLETTHENIESHSEPPALPGFKA
mgnify:CR=1 FL=1